MTKISAAIIAFNEEKHIARTLLSLQQIADEVVVVINDNSTDKTEEICLQYGATVFINNFETYGKQKQYAVTKCTHNLILNIDADEAIDDILANELRKLKTTKIADGYTIGIKNFYCGKWMRFGGINSTKRLRIFNKQKGNWNDAAVHEKIELTKNSNIIPLKGNILHIAFESKAEHIHKLKKYAILNAKKLSAKPVFNLLTKLLTSPISKFVTSYFLKLGILEGKQGLQFAYLMSYETWLKYKTAIKLKSIDYKI